MCDDSSLSAKLRNILSRQETLSGPGIAPYLALGAPTVDAWLGGGLKGNGLHEIYAAEAEDAACATGFALLLTSLGQQDGRKTHIWACEAHRARHNGIPYGPGLLDLGINPASLILLHLPDAKAVLQAGLDSLRDGNAASVLIELHGRQNLFNLTSSRRLALAAAQTDTTVIVVRCGAEPVPSAAHTRWQIRSASSQPLVAHVPGHPAFHLTLLRNRIGREGLQLILEWSRDTVSFQERRSALAPISRPVPALAGSGAGDPERHRAA